MNNSALKDIRKQLRNIVKEELTQVLALEVYKQSMQNIDRELNKRLQEIEKRQQDLISYIMRMTSK